MYHLFFTPQYIYASYGPPPMSYPYWESASMFSKPDTKGLSHTAAFYVALADTPLVIPAIHGVGPQSAPPPSDSPSPPLIQTGVESDSCCTTSGHPYSSNGHDGLKSQAAPLNHLVQTPCWDGRT